MARWLVQLGGVRIDLEQYSRSFPDGEVSVIEEQGEYFLVGQGLEALSESEDVLREANAALDRFYAAVSLLFPMVDKPEIRHLFRKGDDDKPTTHVIGVGAAKSRSRAYAEGVSLGSPPQPGAQSEARNLLDAARRSPHLEEAMSYFTQSPRPWLQLYKVFEAIEKYLGKKAYEAGLCSRNQRERFERSSQSAEASGIDARHSLGRFDPPRSPMSLSEGETFIREVLLKALQSTGPTDQ